jgi:hypothetical protein
MPRWPKEEEKTEQEQASETPALLPLSENVLHDKIDHLTSKVESLDSRLHSLSALELAFKPPVTDPDAPAYQIQRRRDETELRRALKLLASGQLRPQDDDSEQVISDAFGELFAMRQLNYDLMQLHTSAYQNGLAAIRKLTER